MIVSPCTVSVVPFPVERSDVSAGRPAMSSPNTLLDGVGAGLAGLQTRWVDLTRPTAGVNREVLAGPDFHGRGLQFRDNAVPNPSPPESFLTTEEVLAYLQVNLRTVYRLIEAGKLPAVRVGRQWRFRRRDVDAWLDGQRPAAPPPAPADAPRPAAHRARILVVDPDGNTRELIAGALRQAGHLVDTAPDGVVGRDRLVQGGYDLVVTELQLPALDTYGMLREVRHRQPALRAVVVTGHSSERAAIEALNFGIAGYHVKPVRASEIAATAARLLA